MGTALLLHKYITLLCSHVGEVLPLASTVAANGPRYFVASAQVIQREHVGVLLPELLTSIVLLHTSLPAVLETAQIITVLAGLLDMLDKFNKLAPGVSKEDEEDLAWPGGIGLFITNYYYY